MPTLPRWRRSPAALARLRREDGLTIVEAMMAMVVLLMGLLGTFMLIDTANAGDSKVRAREGATNLARELLEEVRDTPYAEVGSSGSWLQATLEGLPGRQGSVSSPDSSSQQVTVSRRGYSYTATVSWCSVDDSRDGYGPHAAGTTYCQDSTSTGTADGKPEDMKRVTVKLSYSVNGAGQPQMVQTATFGSSGVATGPETTDLRITTPSGLSPPYVITSNPTGNIVTFLGTSSGAEDMKFSVDGVEQGGGVTNNLNGTWSYNWNIGSLTDGTYTIGASAIDVLGNRGQPRTIQVKLARGAPVLPQNVTGGYNDIYVSGTTKQVVELEWDANPEGSVTGYSVEKGGVVVSGCAQSIKTACMDMIPATSGDTTYTVKTHYTDGAGNPQSVSTTYTVSAPSAPCATQTVGASADASIYKDNPSTNYPSESYVWARAGASPAPTRTTIAFPLPVLGTCTVSSAALKLYASVTSTDGQIRTLQALRLGSSWSESTVTWNNAPATSGVAATTSSANGWRSWDVTSQVQAMYTGGNYGFLVRDSSETGGSQRWFSRFDSREGTNKPVLEIALGGTTAGALAKPAAPTGLTLTVNADGTRTLAWSAPTSSNPAVEFYRIYRDGQNVADRYDTLGATGSTLTWTDINTGGTSHSYRVTSAAAKLTESDQTAAVSG